MAHRVPRRAGRARIVHTTDAYPGRTEAARNQLVASGAVRHAERIVRASESRTPRRPAADELTMSPCGATT